MYLALAGLLVLTGFERSAGQIEELLYKLLWSASGTVLALLGGLLTKTCLRVVLYEIQRSLIVEEMPGGGQFLSFWQLL